MIKKHLKRGLSLALALVLVVTTFFIFDPDLLRVESDAYVDVQGAEAGAFLSDQTLYATETIYLQTGTNAFQYYENYSYATGAVASPVDTSGEVYFKNNDASAVYLAVNNVYERSTKTQVPAGKLVINNQTVEAYTGLANGTDSYKFVGTILSQVTGGTMDYNITSGSLSGWAEGGVYIIEWLVAYVIDDGDNSASDTDLDLHYAFAYTGIYAAPDDQAGITLAARHQNDDAASHQYNFITGGHKVSGGNAYSAVTDTSGNTKRNPLLGFVGQTNNSSSYTITGSKTAYQLGSSYFPAKAGGGVAAQTYDEKSCGGADTGAGTVEVNSVHRYESSQGSYSVGTYDSPNATGVLRRSFSSNFAENESLMTGVAYLLVDTSRYSNYNQIPNLKVGWTQLYAYDATRDNNVISINVCSDNGTSVDSNYSIAGVDTGDATNDNNNVLSTTRGLYSITGAISAGLKFIEFKSQVTRDRTVSDHRMIITSNIAFHTTTWSQYQLRQQYNTALKSYVDYQNICAYATAYKDTYVSNYYTNLKAVGEELADPTAHSLTNNQNLVTFVENATKAIAAGSAPEVYFYVPEVIYINPVANSSGTYDLQYYVDRVSEDNGKLNTNNAQTSGNVYFHATNATKVTSLSWRWMNEYGGNTVNISLGQTSSTSGTLSTTMTGTINSYTTSYVEWTVTYVNNLGQTLKVHAYSSCYALPLVYQSQDSVISATAQPRNTSSSTWDIGVTGWILGAHTVDGYSYTISDTTSGTLNPTTGDGSGSYKLGFDSLASGTIATSGDRDVSGLFDSGTGGSGYWATEKSVDYTTGGIGSITVDSSRYTNLGQIPNLKVGVDLNRSTHSKEWSLTLNSCLYYDWYSGSTQPTTYSTASDTFSHGSKSISARRTTGTLSSATNTLNQTGTKTLVLMAYCYGNRSDYTRTGKASFYLKCNFIDKGGVREAYDNAIKKSQFLQEEYFKADVWSTYENILVLQAAANLVLPNSGTSQSDFNNIAANLNNQVAMMVGAVTATTETFTYTKSDGTTATANRADILNKGTATVHHVLADFNDDGSLASVSDLAATETKTYYYGETVLSGYNQYEGYNYFGYYLNEGTTKWTESLGTGVLKGDMAAQGTYGTSGQNSYALVKVPNVTYTYVYSKDPSGVYMDWGVSDLAFENKQNLADLTNVDVDTAYTEDGTLYEINSLETTHDGNGTYTSGAAMVSKTDTDAFSFSILNTGYNTYTPKAAGLNNLFNFDTYGWNSSRCTVTPDTANNTLRMVTTGADAYAGNYDGSSATYMTLVPGRSYVFSYNWYNNNGEDSVALLPYIFYSASNNPFSYSNGGTLKSYPQSTSGRNGTHEIEFTVPDGMPYVSLRLGINNGSGMDVTFSDITIVDTADSSQFAKMNDLFFPSVATGLEGGKTYTVSFESSLRYDDYRWYAINMYGGATPEMDWAHEQGTIQMFMSTSKDGDDLYNYTVPVRVTTDITSGGTIGTFTMPSGCSVINLGFCITNDTPIAGWVDNIRITEGDYVEIGAAGESYTLPDPVWEGYSFTGWSEGSAPFNGALAGTLNSNYTYGVSSDTVLASWKINRYDITFDNEFDFDQGWSNPSSANGTLTVDTDENKLTLTTLANASSADNSILSNSIMDIAPGHRYRVSYDYNVTNYVSGGGIQNHFFYYANETDAKNNAWGSIGFPAHNGCPGYIQGSTYPSVASKQQGTVVLEFVVPDTAEYARLRLGNTNKNGMVTEFSNIYVQDITRGSGDNMVHDTTVSEPHLTINGTTMAVKGLVRNYKETIKNSEVTELPVISSELYDFAGWYTGKNGTGTKVTVNDLTEAKTNQKWSHWTVHLDYLLDSTCQFKDGYSAPASQTGIAIGGSATIADHVPYKIGYNFAGWKDSYSGTVYQPGDTITLYCNANLTPVWTEAKDVSKETDYTDITKLYPGQIYFYAYTPANNDEYVSGYVYGATPDLTVALYSSSAVIANGNTDYTYGVTELDSLVTSALTKGTEYYYGVTGDITATTEVTGNFKISEHYINYALDANGGSVSTSAAVGHYNTTTALPTPTRTGYTFSTWKNLARNTTFETEVSASENNTIITGNTASFVTSQNLQAQWNINSYDLNVYAYYNQAASATEVGTTYSLDTSETGGYVLIDSVKSTSGAATKNVVYNSTVTYSAVANTGYTFMGWYSAPTITDGTITAWGDVADSTDASCTISNMGAADKNVYARFDINKYPVTLYAYCDTNTNPGEYAASTQGGTVKLDNGSGALSATQNYVYGQTFTMTATPATGYAFKGWYYGSNELTGVAAYGASSVDVTINEGLIKNASEIVYKARFDIQKYQLSLNANGGVVTGESTYTGYMGDTVTVAEPTRPGYSFTGWSIVDNTTSGTANGTMSGTSYTFGAGNDRATANWAVNNYPITIDPAGGEVTVNYFVGGDGDTHIADLTASTTLNMDYDSVASLNAPTRTGYTFAHWVTTDATGVLTEGTAGNASTYKVGLEDKAVITATWNVNQYQINAQVWGDAISSEGTYTIGEGGTVKIGADGTEGTNVTGNVNYGETATLIATPETGYTFLGWQTTSPSTGLADDRVTTAEITSATMTEKGLQYYAVFGINEYDVTLKAVYNTAADIGTFTEGTTGGTVTGEGTYSHGENVTLQATPATGYTFLGWYNGENEVSSNSTYSFSITEETALTAKFTVSEYTITTVVMSNTANNPDEFLNNDQAGTVEGDTTYYHGETTSITATAKTGYAFVGWYNDNNDLVTESATLAVTVNKNATYRARFKVIMVDVNLFAMSNAEDLGNYTLNGIGGTVSYDGVTYADTVTGQCAYGGQDTIYAKPATGYQFDGWYSDSSLQTALGSGNYHSEGYYDYNLAVNSAEGISLYAKFSVGSYSLKVYAYSNSGNDITYYENNNVGGTISVAEGNAPLAGDIETADSNGAYAAVNVYFGKNALITATAKTGYTFDGWYTDSAFNTWFNSTADGAETAAMETTGLSYYAKFSVNSFTLEYDPNGGISGDVKIETLYYNTSHIINTAATPEDRVGYVFLGWSLNPQATQAELSNGQSVPALTINEWYATYGNKVTLYAVWATSANTIYANAAYSPASGVYYMDYSGTKGGSVEVVPLNGESDLDQNGNVVVPLGAAVEDYIQFNPASGYTFMGWRYSLYQSDVPADGATISTNWCNQGLGTTTMPAQPIFVVGYFEIQTFAATAYAYYNTAAEPTDYIYGATGGTVKLGRTGTNASTVISENVNFGQKVFFIATPARGYSFSGWYATPVITDGVVTEWGTAVNTDTEYYVEVADTSVEGQETANDYYAVFSINSYNATASVRTYTVREDMIYSLGEDQWPGGTPSNTGGNVGIGLTATADDSWKWTAFGALNPSIDGKVYYGQRVYFEAKPNVGYIFGGWYDVQDAEYYGENLVEEESLTYSRIMREGDMYMEAKFIPVSFTLVLDANGGTAGNPMEIIVTYGSPFKIADSSIPTKTGSTFLGWADAAESTTAVDAYSITITPEIISQWYATLTDVNSAYTIYAVWETAYVKVEFDKQGATGGENDVSITVGETLPPLTEIPTYEGFVFGGYFSDIGGEGVRYYNADGTATAQPWNDTTGGTVYALWTCPVLKEISYDTATNQWIYTYEDKDGGETPVTSSTALTSPADVTDQVKNEESLMWWKLKVDELDTSYVESQIEKTPEINLNHYTDTALVDLLAAVVETNTDQKLGALTQPQANAYVARMAKDMELDFSENKKAETDAPTVTLYENSAKVNMIKGETIAAAADSANGSTYSVPSSSDSASYAYAGKWSYTAGAAVDYYLYTNSPNPVIALEIGDGAVATTVADNTSSYPTKATVTDNAAGFSYVNGKSMTSAVKATDDLDNAWFTKYTTAGVGTAHDYNAKTVIYLTPEFSASGTKNEIVYTVSASDDASTPNVGMSSAEISGTNPNMSVKFDSYSYDVVEAERIEKDDPTIDKVEDITICICYHNSMNGDSDEGTLDASGTYMQMYMDQVQDDVWLNQLHLLRNSGGASNWDFPMTSENVYPVEDVTYPYSDLGCTIGSFIYVFDATNEPTATSYAEAGDYAEAKKAIISSVSGNANSIKTALNDSSDKLNINGNDTGLGVFPITGWSCNFYPKSGSYVYAHLIDRWGNVFNRVWKCYNVDSYPSTINGVDGASVYNVFEDGGSNIGDVVLDGADVEFVLDENSTYENGVFTTTGNTVTLSTGEANKTYSLTVTDKATNTTTMDVTTDGDGVLVLNVEDAKADLSTGAYTFTLNGETVNLYAGVDKLVLAAEISSVSLIGSETKVTVKTSKDAIKVQLVEGVATRTFTKDLADVVENEDGTLTWNISFKTTLGVHTYGVKGRTVSGWEDTDYVLTTEVVKAEVTDPIALKSVYNAEIYTGEKAEIKVRTEAGTEKLQIVYPNGSTSTFNRSEDIIITTVDNVETWVLKTSAFAKAGDYELTIRAKYNGAWQSNTKVSTVKVTDLVVDTTPVIYSVEAESSTVKRGEATALKVVTNSNTIKVRLNYALSTSTFNESNADVVENADGTKTWTINVKFYSLGENDINLSAKSATGWIDGQSFGTIEVTK
ncbi:MAG: InlB B-repeat-containing protein [Clostridia bacterium]|nr:InlB B-repeat-containing protein [Clostridia bacterium]